MLAVKHSNLRLNVRSNRFSLPAYQFCSGKFKSFKRKLASKAVNYIQLKAITFVGLRYFLTQPEFLSCSEAINPILTELFFFLKKLFVGFFVHCFTPNKKKSFHKKILSTSVFFLTL